MINKKNLWFLTLFSLILVLSIYYITMPNELLLTANTKNVIRNDTPDIKVDESDILVSLRVDSDTTVEKEINELEMVLTNVDASIDEKNKAYEKIKEINTNRSEEENIEKFLKEKYNLNSFVKLKDNEITITIKSENKGANETNKIMRAIQERYDSKKYITIKFKA